MFVGHTAVALAAKSRMATVALGWWVAAAFALDLLWPFLLLAGIEGVSIVPGATAFNPLIFDSYPWSHSLVMACVWGLGLWQSVPATLLIEGLMFTGGVVLYLRATRAVDRVGVGPVVATAAEFSSSGLVCAGHLAAGCVGRMGRSTSTHSIVVSLTRVQTGDRHG